MWGAQPAPYVFSTMKIVKIGFHCCIRLQKEAFALLAKGHEVHVIGNSIPSAVQEFTTFSQFITSDQLRKTLLLHKDADIIHVHNEPSWPVIVAKEVLPDIPVVLDVHDAMIFRSTDVKHKSAEERLTFDMADGMVFVSEKCREVINPKSPSCLLLSYVNEMFYQFNAWQWIGGLAYEGRIDTPEQKGFMFYCNYVDLCKELRKEDIPFHIYAPGVRERNLTDCYEQICKLHPALPYDKLIQILGCHDWGLCGNIKKYREWDLAMPNKLFEYMAGGIPTIALNCGEVADFVLKHGVGIAVKSVKEIVDRWDERQECQKNVFLKRFEFTMEKHIGILEDFYKKLIRGK